jgi:hypothetical protein
MMKPAKDRMRNNVSEPFDRARAGRVLPERDMRSHLVIIDGVLREDSSKVLRVERDQMICALAPDRPDQAFSISVLPGRRNEVTCTITAARRSVGNDPSTAGLASRANEAPMRTQPP